MAAIILPQPRTSQPQHPVGLDRGNPLTRGIIACVAPPLGVGTVNSGVTAAVSNPGEVWTFTTGSATQEVSVPTKGYTGGSPFSVLVICKSTASSGTSQSLASINFNGTNVPFYLSLGNTVSLGVTGCWIGYYSGGWKTTPSGTEIRNDGLWHVVAGGVVSGSQRCFLDGALIGSATGSGTSGNNTNAISFGNYKNDSTSLGGQIALGIVWDRFLSDAEFIEVSANPWQVFAPLPRRIFAGPAAAAGVYELIANNGSYSLTGQSATLTKTYEVTASNGSYSLTGQSADLTWAGAGSYTLTAQAGSYSLTGQSATLLKTNVLTASNGSYSLTGQSATLTYASAAAYVLTAQAGSYTLTGQNATLTNSGEVVTVARPQVGIDWGALVQKTWGKEYGKPEYEYEFSNGRRFLGKNNPYS